MPKQIKKRELKKSEKAAAALSSVMMAAAVIFSALFIILIPDLDSGSESVQFAKAISAAAGYVLFVAVSAAAGVMSFIAFKKSKQMGDAMRAFFSAVSVLTALLSIRFMLALFFAGIDDQDMLDKIIGSGSYSSFVKNQAPSFACLVIALAVALFVGISAIVKLVKR